MAYTKTATLNTLMNYFECFSGVALFFGVSLAFSLLPSFDVGCVVGVDAFAVVVGFAVTGAVVAGFAVAGAAVAGFAVAGFAVAGAVVAGLVVAVFCWAVALVGVAGVCLVFVVASVFLAVVFGASGVCEYPAK